MNQKIHIKTFGCSANQSDSEVMAGLLKEAGYKLVSSMEKADLVIINSCGVKHRAEIDFFREIDNAKKMKKKIIACGCIPSGNKKLIETKLRGLSVMDVNSIKEIAFMAEQTLKGKQIVLFGKNKIEKIGFPKERKNKVIAIVPIAEGCLGNCTYCFTKLAKGGLYSYPEDCILREIESALAQGCKEIWLTSQDCAAYGLDKKTNLARLLEKVCNIHGRFYVRVGMGNPNHILKILPELIKIYKNPKVFKFLHIPVQSGCNRILRLMNRFYKVRDFKKIITKFRKEIPNITISTDIICGFPCETDEEFKDSLKLIKWLQPDVINVSRFWPRPGTKAAEMKQLSGAAMKERSGKLSKLYGEIALGKNQEWIGKKCDVLIDETGTKGGLVARNKEYKPIVIKNKKLKLGSHLKVKINSTTKDYLIA